MNSPKRSGFSVMIPNDFLPVFHHIGDGNTIDDKVRIRLSMMLFIEGEISLERAAELADMSLVDYMDLLKEKNIPWLNYTEEQFELDEEFLRNRRESQG